MFPSAVLCLLLSWVALGAGDTKLAPEQLGTASPAARFIKPAKIQVTTAATVAKHAHHPGHQQHHKPSHPGSSSSSESGSCADSGDSASCSVHQHFKAKHVSRTLTMKLPFKLRNSVVPLGNFVESGDGSMKDLSDCLSESDRSAGHGHCDASSSSEEHHWKKTKAQEAVRSRALTPTTANPTNIAPKITSPAPRTGSSVPRAASAVPRAASAVPRAASTTPKPTTPTPKVTTNPPPTTS